MRKLQRAADCGRLGSAAPSARRRRAARVSLLASLLLASGFAPLASAHDARPLSIEITQQSADLFRARLRVPPIVADDDRPAIAWPANCRVVSDRITPDSVTPGEVMLARCADGLDGRTLRIHYPLYNPSLSTLIRLTSSHGAVRTQVLPPDRPEWTVPPETTWKRVALGYLELGIRHIWTGIDHLLFVSGLLLLAGSMRRVLLAITGFTVAHSLTLSLSVTRLVELPQAPVEAAIALSILFLACELARPARDGLARRHPLSVASSFGLLHGFGFAAALREAGLPAHDLALALFSFNLGVEAGQIVFIAAALAIIRPLAGPKKGHPASDPRWGYALGVPAAFWLVQRLAALG
jgi:hydrogenase/urease accessory protein HupE